MSTQATPDATSHGAGGSIYLPDVGAWCSWH